MQPKLKKIFLSLAVAFELFALTAAPVLAISIPSASSIASDLEKRYHLNTQSLQNYGENSNVADNKKVAPQVLLTFSPTDPNIGEQITATATPLYFQNASEDLYYTWYLKHPECKEAHSGDSGYLKKCDLNDDDRVNIKDWKIEAMRLIATNGFDWNRALGQDSPNCAGANQPEYCSQPNAYQNATDDKDSYKALFGGNDRQKMPEHCYLHDFESGINYELADNLSGTGVTCTDPVKQPYCVQTTQQVAGDMASTTQQCEKTTGTLACTSSSASNVSCSDGTTPMCVDPSVISGDTVSSTLACSSLPSSDPTKFDTAFGCNNSSFSSNPDLVCKHLFPNAPGETTGDNSFGRGEEKFWHTNPADPDTANNGNRDEANVVGLGQEKFTWNYEPGDKVGVAVEGASVNSTKYDDSSMMVMWALPKNKCNIGSTGTYNTQIKGYNVSIPVTDKDINDCLPDNLVDPKEGGQSSKLDIALSYTPDNPINDASGAGEGDELTLHAALSGSNDHTYLKYAWEIYTADDMNPADWGAPVLKSALPGVSQTSGLGLDTLKFKLNFFNPVPKFLKAKVNVSENISAGVSNTGFAEVIIPLNSAANKIHVFPAVVSPAQVLALGQPERCATGLDKALCPVVQNEVVGVQLDNPGRTFTNFVWTVNGEILKPINYPSGGACLSGECLPANGAGTNIAFFNVLQEKGTRYNISVTADNVDGKKITVTKAFEVNDPAIKIVSSNVSAVQPVLLGNYVDLNNVSWPDYSDSDLETTPGSVITLMPILNNPFVQNFVWYIDGVPMTADNLPLFGATVDAANGTLTFPANKQLGDNYAVSIQALYAQDTNTKKFLNQTAGVQLDEFYESTIGDSVNIQLVNALSGTPTAKAGGNQQLLASLFTGLPAYLNFLFRIVLTTLLILAVSWVVMAISPRVPE